MNAGIKYCGGCNPKYDRAVLSRRLVEATNQKVLFEAVQEGREYDMLIVICGCTCRCADYSRVKYKDAVIVITSEEDFTAAYQALMMKFEDQ